MFRWLRRRRQPPQADPSLPQTILGAVREDRGRFADLSGARVLIYWPHGFGDWVTVSTIAPLLEPSNAYAITRFGDDYVSVMEGNDFFAPLYSGSRTPGDGSDRGARHFGLELRDCDGRKVTMALPPPLDEAVMEFAPELLLWTDYPETEGRAAYPFHTKARNAARLLVRPERLGTFDLSQPLRSTIDFNVSEDVQAKVDERLAAFAPAGCRICVISRAGVTAARKNWGDGSEARAFVEAIVSHDRRWKIVSMDDEPLTGATAGFRTLFSGIDEPFARVMKALVARAELFAGVPAGPLHFAMARGGVPTIGLWLSHHPDWYDEPNPLAIHLVGRYVRDHGFDRRPATTTKPPSLRHEIVYLDGAEIPAAAVIDAVRALGVS